MPNKNTPQFKVGDKVKILDRKGSSTKYFPVYIDSMLKYAGRLAMITLVSQQGCQIDLDNGVHYWPFEVLQLVTSEVDKTVDPYNLKNGDYIKITHTFTSNTSLIYIFKEVKNDMIYRHASYNPESKNINVNQDMCWALMDSIKITYATEEEKKLLDNALLEEGYRWNNLTKQLDIIGVVDISTNNLNVQPIGFSSLDTSDLESQISKLNDLLTNSANYIKRETQTETELNLFPKKKHYQLNFNY